MKDRASSGTQRGITLIELLITIAIASILMAIAMPSYKYITNTNRVAAEVNGLLGDMQYAREEAIKEGQNVVVCAATANTCVNGNAWQDGWMVFSDLNGDGTFDTGDPILRVQMPFTTANNSSDTFVAADTQNTAIDAFVFNREGFATTEPNANATSGTVMVSLHVANDTSSVWTRCLAVTIVGLLTVKSYEQTYYGATCQ